MDFKNFRWGSREVEHHNTDSIWKLRSWLKIKNLFSVQRNQSFFSSHCCLYTNVAASFNIPLLNFPSLCTDVIHSFSAIAPNLCKLYLYMSLIEWIIKYTRQFRFNVVQYQTTSFITVGITIQSTFGWIATNFITEVLQNKGCRVHEKQVSPKRNTTEISWL